MGAIDEKKMRLLKEVSSMKKYWINKVKQIEDTMLETYQIEDENDKSVINIELSNELSDRIKTVTKNNPFAEFVLFFSVYQILLQRYNNSRYQVVLTPAFELKQKKLENWVFCEIEDSHDKNFKYLINDNIKKFIDIFANQFYSIEELMAEKSEILNFLCKNIFVLETCQNINAIEKYLNSKKNQVAFVINKKENSFEVKCYHFKNENKEDACSMIRHVPLGSTHLGRIAALNQLSREICSHECSLRDAWVRLEECKSIPKNKNWVEIFFCGVGSAGFCYLFGGTALDSFVAFFIGLVLQIFLIASDRHLESKFITNILGSGIVTFLSLIVLSAGIPILQDKVVIGDIMPLVPGIALTTSIRDFFNGDYLSGAIHMIDAILTAFSIAVGVGAVITLYQLVTGGALLR